MVWEGVREVMKATLRGKQKPRREKFQTQKTAKMADKTLNVNMLMLPSFPGLM